MSALIKIILFASPLVAIFAAVYSSLRSFSKTSNSRRALRVHFGTLVSVFALLMCCTGVASAETADAAVSAAMSNGQGISNGLKYIGAGLCTGLAGIGGGVALASGIPAAIGATTEDPTSFGKSLIFVALGETIALYGVVISFMIISAS